MIAPDMQEHLNEGFHFFYQELDTLNRINVVCRFCNAVLYINKREMDQETYEYLMDHRKACLEEKNNKFVTKEDFHNIESKIGGIEKNLNTMLRYMEAEIDKVWEKMGNLKPEHDTYVTKEDFDNLVEKQDQLNNQIFGNVGHEKKKNSVIIAAIDELSGRLKNNYVTKEDYDIMVDVQRDINMRLQEQLDQLTRDDNELRLGFVNLRTTVKDIRDDVEEERGK